MKERHSVLACFVFIFMTSLQYVQQSKIKEYQFERNYLDVTLNNYSSLLNCWWWNSVSQTSFFNICRSCNIFRMFGRKSSSVHGLACDETDRDGVDGTPRRTRSQFFRRSRPSTRRTTCCENWFLNGTLLPMCLPHCIFNELSLFITNKVSSSKTLGGAENVCLNKDVVTGFN